MSSLFRQTSFVRRVPRGPAIAIAMWLVMLILPSLTTGSVEAQNYRDIFQNFATVAPLAIAMGITMIMAEFDISVISTFALGGVLAVKVGDSSGIFVGTLAAVAAGAVAGIVQGSIIARFNISSVPVTLAGFLLIWGLTEVVAGGQQVASENFAPGEKLLSVVAEYFTLGSILVIAGVVIAHLLLCYTKLGRDLRAVGGDRRASKISGIRVPWVIVGTFAASGLIAGLGGALQGFSFSNANPLVSFNPLVSAVIAAIIGGVGISGATGSPLGIGCGVLALGTLSETLVITEVSSDLATVITGGFLLAIAIISAPDLRVLPTRLLPGLARRSKRSALDPEPTS